MGFYNFYFTKIDEVQVKIIEEAMADISNNSCILFSQRKEDEQAVLIQVIFEYM